MSKFQFFKPHIFQKISSLRHYYPLAYSYKRVCRVYAFNVVRNNQQGTQTVYPSKTVLNFKRYSNSSSSKSPITRTYNVMVVCVAHNFVHHNQHVTSQELVQSCLCTAICAFCITLSHHEVTYFKHYKPTTITVCSVQQLRFSQLESKGVHLLIFRLCDYMGYFHHHKCVAGS